MTEVGVRRQRPTVAAMRAIFSQEVTSRTKSRASCDVTPSYNDSKDDVMVKNGNVASLQGVIAAGLQRQTVSGSVVTDTSCRQSAGGSAITESNIQLASSPVRTGKQLNSKQRKEAKNNNKINSKSNDNKSNDNKAIVKPFVVSSAESQAVRDFLKANTPRATNGSHGVAQLKNRLETTEGTTALVSEMKETLRKRSQNPLNANQNTATPSDSNCIENTLTTNNNREPSPPRNTLSTSCKETSKANRKENQTLSNGKESSNGHISTSQSDKPNGKDINPSCTSSGDSILAASSRLSASSTDLTESSDVTESKPDDKKSAPSLLKEMKRLSLSLHDVRRRLSAGGTSKLSLPVDPSTVDSSSSSSESENHQTNKLSHNNNKTQSDKPSHNNTKNEGARGLYQSDKPCHNNNNVTIVYVSTNPGEETSVTSEGQGGATIVTSEGATIHCGNQQVRSHGNISEITITMGGEGGASSNHAYKCRIKVLPPLSSLGPPPVKPRKPAGATVTVQHNGCVEPTVSTSAFQLSPSELAVSTGDNRSLPSTLDRPSSTLNRSLPPRDTSTLDRSLPPRGDRPCSTLDRSLHGSVLGRALPPLPPTGPPLSTPLGPPLVISVGEDDFDDEEDPYDDTTCLRDVTLTSLDDSAFTEDSGTLIPELTEEEELSIDGVLNSSQDSEDLYADALGNQPELNSPDEEDLYQDTTCLKDGTSDSGSSTYGGSQAPCYSTSKEDKKKQKQEQKERERRERAVNKLKKKYKVTGQEIPLQLGRVREPAPGKRLDLGVSQGEVVGILRMNDNPPGRWLVQNQTGHIGYVELTNIVIDVGTIKSTMSAVYKSVGDSPPLRDSQVFEDELYQDISSPEQPEDGEAIYEEFQV